MAHTSKKRTPILLTIILGLCCLGNSSCTRVAQIDRGLLAKTIMQFDPMPRQQAFVNDVHATREGAAGGAGQNAGGGCGCK